MSELTAFIEQRYRSPDNKWQRAVEQIELLWEKFRPFADPDFVQGFCTNNHVNFQQRYWELFMGAYLIDQGIALNPNNGDGPDFSFDIAGRRVWVEAISPGPGDGNNRVPDNRPSTPNVVEVFDAPVIPVLLRHTAAIDEKFRKYQRYRERGVVGPSDPFLIAVDSSQLGLSGFEGGSGFPAALEAVYPLGAMQVHFAVGSPEQTRTDHQYRPAVQNANSANVQTTRFLDEAYAGISGIIAADRCDVYLLNYPIRPVVLVHNKVATNPIPEGQLKVDFEYHIEEQAGGYTIRRTGR